MNRNKYASKNTSVLQQNTFEDWKIFHVVGEKFTTKSRFHLPIEIGRIPARSLKEESTSPGLICLLEIWLIRYSKIN